MSKPKGLLISVFLAAGLTVGGQARMALAGCEPSGHVNEHYNQNNNPKNNVYTSHCVGQGDLGAIYCQQPPI